MTRSPLAGLRERSERYLREAAMEDLRRAHPDAAVPAYRQRGGVLWRRLFVPLYRRTPWEWRRRAIEALMSPKGWGPGRSWAGRPKLPPLDR
jgi:hypothetical protein